MTVEARTERRDLIAELASKRINTGIVEDSGNTYDEIVEPSYTFNIDRYRSADGE